MQKFLTWAGVAFVVFFVAARPQSAAEIVRTIGSTVVDIGQGFMDFVSSLV